MLKRACMICLLSCAVFMVSGIGASRALPNSKGPQPADAHAKWNALADEYFEQAYFKFNPTAGTSAGLHQYDPVLEEYSRAAVDRQIHTLHIFEERVAAFDVSSLDQTEAADQQLVLSNILGTLLTLETIRPWEKNPDIYSSGIAASAFTIMSRRFAPPDDRLHSLIAREKQIPAVFGAALAVNLAGEAAAILIGPRIPWPLAPRFLESAMALTVAYLAVEILMASEARHLMWIVAVLALTNVAVTSPFSGRRSPGFGTM